MELTSCAAAVLYREFFRLRSDASDASDALFDHRSMLRRRSRGRAPAGRAGRWKEQTTRRPESSASLRYAGDGPVPMVVAAMMMMATTTINNGNNIDEPEWFHSVTTRHRSCEERETDQTGRQTGERGRERRNNGGSCIH